MIANLAAHRLELIDVQVGGAVFVAVRSTIEIDDRRRLTFQRLAASAEKRAPRIIFVVARVQLDVQIA